jgi:hypothetical protein
MDIFQKNISEKKKLKLDDMFKHWNRISIALYRATSFISRLHTLFLTIFKDICLVCRAVVDLIESETAGNFDEEINK